MKFRAYRQTIVFALYIALFAGFALMLPGFASVDNLLTLLQNVAILGILGLGMAVLVNVVISTLLIGTMLNGMTILDMPYSVQNIV